jgi:SpoVK/Ycf46/Vps4 family AAA+-type ATPase
MKKANVINLIKYYTEKNDIAFRNEAYEIADAFNRMGDQQLAEYIMALLSDASTFVPQINENQLHFVRKAVLDDEPLPLPEAIEADLIGIVNSVGHGFVVNKFLFQGPPGTGKTESAKHVARILDRDLFVADFSSLVDSRLGQTSKNISQLFHEINHLAAPEKVVILFDEIDAIALDRTDSNDLREMGRATTTVLKGLDELNERILLIATTNLFEFFDKALVRRFDYVVDFGRYSNDDLLEISEMIFEHYLSNYKNSSKDIRLFRKIMSIPNKLPYPGDIKNIIKTSLAFSNPNEEFDYLRRLYAKVSEMNQIDLKTLQKQGFTLREMEVLTGISRSQISRDLREK